MIVFVILVLVGLVAYMVYFINKKPEAPSPEAAGGMTDSMIADLQGQAELIQKTLETRFQAEAAGDSATLAALDNDTYKGPWPEQRSDGFFLSLYDNLRIISIAGLNMRSGVSRYRGRCDCRLVPEPDNEVDPDAIKVVAMDGHHLGYVYQDQTDMVRSFTKEESPFSCTAKIEQRDNEEGGTYYAGCLYIRTALYI
jgi:hypothetical protein